MRSHTCLLIAASGEGRCTAVCSTGRLSIHDAGGGGKKRHGLGLLRHPVAGRIALVSHQLLVPVACAVNGPVRSDVWTYSVISIASPLHTLSATVQSAAGVFLCPKEECL